MAELQPRTPQHIGIALEATFIRIAARDRGELFLTEHEWDSNAPERVVDKLRAMFGSKRSIALSVGLSFLEIAKPELPPLSPENLRRVLRRDADRYFPLEGAAAIAGPFDAGLTYATYSEWLQRCVRAFEEWGAVRSVVAAPTAIAEALRFGVRSSTKQNTSASTASQSFVVDAFADEFGLIVLREGIVREVRRISRSTALQSIVSATPLEECSLNVRSTNVATYEADGKHGAPAKYAAAIGALNLLNAPLSEMLLDAELERKLQSRRERRQWTSYALLAASVLLLVASANARRTSTLRATQRAVDSLSQLAAPGLASQKQLAQLGEEFRILSTHNDATRDPLHVVATLSKTLPADAFVERLAWDGNEWRLDGSANQAASVVPHLDSAHAFTDVRVLTASTRFRDGARMRESFSVAFKLKGDSSARR
ncbi:MAG: PilN domain-containing protein [Gemmatimonadaceae bacterium]